jgi:arabinofuranosyltransferase
MRLPPVQRALALGPVVLWAAMAWRARWVCDDAFIDLVVVRNLLAGHGPLLNVGERVEVFSNPLWVAALTVLGAVVPGDPGRTLPWLAALLGLALSLLGLAAPSIAAARRAHPDHARDLALPLGGLVVAALAPFHDFATSGLETGMSFAWLGLTWTLVDPRDPRPPRTLRRHAAVAVLTGLGVLVRPDLAVFSLALTALHLSADPARSRTRVALGALAALALPALWQLFRMAWYASLVANTALAKEATLTRWDQGWRYLTDFNAPYELWVPALALVALTVLTTRRAWRGYTLSVAALVHALGVMRLGGDFMHARMLLPSLFALCLPVVLTVGGARRGLAVVLPWAALTLYGAVAHPRVTTPRAGIVDERAYYVAESGVAHPITLDDYAATSWHQGATTLRQMAASQRALAVAGTTTLDGRTRQGFTVPALRPDLPQRVVAANAIALGITAFAAGPTVAVRDAHGLADPLGARIQLLRRGRPGHEKDLAPSWVVARYGDFDSPAMPPALRDHPAVQAARRTLRCGPVAELVAATTAPWTVARALRNLRVAWSLTRLRIPADPRAAERTLCPRGAP